MASPASVNLVSIARTPSKALLKIFKAVDEIKVPEVLKKCTHTAETSKRLRIVLASRILKDKLSDISNEHPTYLAQIACDGAPGEIQITLEILLPGPPSAIEQVDDGETDNGEIERQDDGGKAKWLRADEKLSALLQYML